MDFILPDILVLDDQGPSGKWPLKQREKENTCIVISAKQSYMFIEYFINIPCSICDVLVFWLRYY